LESQNKLAIACKRVAFDIGLFIINFVLLFHASLIQKQALQLLLYKSLLVNAGFLHAHIMRKLAFGDFSEATPNKQYLMIAIYVAVIFTYARGG